MGQKEYAKCCGSLKAGPAGIGCPCCNPFGMSPRKMKPKSRRLYRRTKKLNLKKVQIDD